MTKKAYRTDPDAGLDGHCFQLANVSTVGLNFIYIFYLILADSKGENNRGSDFILIQSVHCTVILLIYFCSRFHVRLAGGIAYIWLLQAMLQLESRQSR